jgi:hypothetical protein
MGYIYCSLLAILTYGFGFVGSLSFMAFGLHALNKGKYESHHSGYFKGRLTFYSLVLAVGGAVQLAVGAYAAAEFGFGPLKKGPVSAAFIVVHYPIVTLLVGVIQLLHGLWGIARSFGEHSGPSDNIYQLSMAGQWIVVLVFQIIMQIAYFPSDGKPVQMAAFIAAMSFGINMMPAFLDYKMRSVPQEIPHGYYIEVPKMEMALPEAPTSGGMDVSGRSRMHESVSNIKTELDT